MTTPVSGQGLSPEEEELEKGMSEHWRKVWNETPVQTITRLEEAAKQVITLTVALQGLYLTIFAFSNLRTQLSAIPSVLPSWLLWIILLLPLACWLISLFSAIRVFIPEIRPEVNFNELSVGAWQKVKDAYGQAAEKKLHWLHLSHRWLVASFVFVFLAVVLFACLPTLSDGPTQIITVTPTPTVRPHPA
jgi:hypothetical protein